MLCPASNIVTTSLQFFKLGMKCSLKVGNAWKECISNEESLFTRINQAQPHLLIGKAELVKANTWLNLNYDGRTLCRFIHFIETLQKKDHLDVVLRPRGILHDTESLQIWDVFSGWNNGRYISPHRDIQLYFPNKNWKGTRYTS